MRLYWRVLQSSAITSDGNDSKIGKVSRYESVESNENTLKQYFKEGNFRGQTFLRPR